MRLHHPLDDILSSPARLSVIRTLLRFPDLTWTGRQLALAAGCSPPQAINALAVLEAMGLTSRQVVGRAHRWRLIREHVLVEPLRSLFSFEAELPTRFRRELARELRAVPVRTATLFGSMARGTETNASDADLCLVREGSASEEDVQQALTPIETRFVRRYGTVLLPLIYTREELARPRNPQLIRNIRTEGIPLIEEPS